MGRVDGKVAFVTGAARGQGRSHAIRLAQEGADIIAVDLCDQIATVEYPMATPEDLAETVKEVEALDRRIVAKQADVRDQAALKAALDEGVTQLGGVDIVLANAGTAPMGAENEDRIAAWQDVVGVNLTGVWNTVEAAAPRMVEQGRGGALANLLPVELVEPVDISNAILRLVSDEARYVTGVTRPVDAGFTTK
jgi:NAD(P)-dependent dehydrogenase (short-subunit alcohol dehydrogenase family)